MKLPSHTAPNHEFWVLRARMELPSFRISIHITENSHMPDCIHGFVCCQYHCVLMVMLLLIGVIVIIVSVSSSMDNTVAP